jgi:hypothetical protein
MEVIVRKLCWMSLQRKSGHNYCLEELYVEKLKSFGEWSLGVLFSNVVVVNYAFDSTTGVNWNVGLDGNEIA